MMSTLLLRALLLLALAATTALAQANVSAQVTTLAGSARSGSSQEGYADGNSTTAKFSSPNGLAIDPANGSYVLVADSGNHRIRKASILDGVVTTLAGGSPGYADGNSTAAKFGSPRGLAIDPAKGSYVLVADQNHRIRKASIPDGVVTTLAGSSLGLIRSEKYPENSPYYIKPS